MLIYDCRRLRGCRRRPVLLHLCHRNRIVRPGPHHRHSYDEGDGANMYQEKQYGREGDAARLLPPVVTVRIHGLAPFSSHQDDSQIVVSRMRWNFGAVLPFLGDDGIPRRPIFYSIILLMYRSAERCTASLPPSVTSVPHQPPNMRWNRYGRTASATPCTAVAESGM